ncbi:MAG: glycogen branching enzyme [Labilithrix sp.]|nr:glycogen branching enzyme [Labilithrix sp.]
MNGRMRLSCRSVVVLASLLAAPLGGCQRAEPATRTSAPPLPAAGSAKAPAAAVVEAPPPSAPEPAPPPYDLAAERERRIGAARTELGPRALATVVSDIFVVVGPPGFPSSSFESSVALMRSSMSAYLNGRFGKKPGEAITVYLFPEGSSYERFCKATYGAPCLAHYGFYEPGRRYMVMNIGLGAGTLTHEIVHPLVEADFPEAPTWLNEGIASVFEAPVIPRPGEIHGVKNWRHPRLARALLSHAERDRAQLATVFTLADETFRSEDEDLHYAMARYICQWLDARGKLWPFYQRWRDTAAADPTGRQAFTDVVGMSPEQASPVWAKWALAL